MKRVWSHQNAELDKRACALFRSFVCFALSPTYVFFSYSPPNDEQTNRHTRFEQEETRVERQNSTGCARYRATREKSRGEQKEAKTSGKLNRSRRSSEEKNFGDFQARGDAPKERVRSFFTRERNGGQERGFLLKCYCELCYYNSSPLFSFLS